MDLPRVFLTVRLFHAAIFAFAAALFVLLVRNFTGCPASVSAVVPLFLVPALPQFGMHVSNYAPLLAAYTVLGAGVVIASWDGPRSWAAGPILGFGLGAAIGMSRSLRCHCCLWWPPSLPRARCWAIGTRAGRPRGRSGWDSFCCWRAC